MNIVLVEPEIPANTGNVARLCAATHTTLHLVEPFGFRLDDAQLKRAGMDYWQHVEWHRWTSWIAFQLKLPTPARLWFVESNGPRLYTEASYAPDDEAGAAVKAAASSDVAIVVVGNHPTCGPNMGKEWTKGGDTEPCADPGEGREGRDRETLALSQEELVRKVLAANPRTVLVLVSSFPYTITWSQEHVPAIVHMAHSSQDEGWALAQVLFGNYNPGGHTIVTWPASMEQLPPMLDYDIRHGRTYMYFKGTPLYPFGYGLSYTTFKFARLRTDKPGLTRDGQLLVSVDVTNTGKVAGDAVPQLYVHHLGSQVERPEIKLAGFSRVRVEPGQTKTVQIPLKASQLAYWDAGRKAFAIEQEPIELLVGASSADITLKKEIRVR